MDKQLKEMLLDRAAEKLATQLAGEKHDIPAGFTLSTNFMHGPSGIFGVAGLERDVFATRVTPRGLLSAMPAFGTVDMNPIQPYLTGFTGSSGSEPDEACEACVKAGEIKSCMQGTAFGEICRETRPLDLSAIGQRVNRGEFTDLRVVNDPLLTSNQNWVPNSVSKAAQQVLNREVLALWMTLGYEFEKVLSQMVYTGNVANSNAAGYMEYNGLELLVTTGHTDVLTSTSCPSLDSDVKDMNYATVENNAADIFAYMTMVYRYVRHNAETMNMNPVQWVWVMKDSLFRKLADYWPCVYASFRCNATANDVTNNTDAMEMRRMSDAIYNGRYLLIDGIQIPVVIDDAIPYEEGGQTDGLDDSQFASDIYLLPMTVKGGMPVTYLEYFDYSASGAMMDGVNDGRLTNFYWSDGGRFVWNFNQTSWCVEWKAKIKPRLRLLTPHLAGRLQNIVWQPLQMFREPFDDQGYFVDGGDTTRSNAPYSLSQ